MKNLLTAVTLMTSLISCQSLANEDPFKPMDMPAPEKYVPFTPEELELIGPQDPTLHGGKEIKKGDLMFSVYIGNCTASIVGPKVIMTAGHCRDTGDSASFTLEGKKYSGKCYQHPQYSKGPWLNNDFALCIMTSEIDTPVMASLEPVPMNEGDAVIMQGYGQGSAGGRLNYGRTKIVRSDDMEYTTNDTVKLGPGDSGGGFLKDASDVVNGPFWVVGVNSRAAVGGKQSYFNRVNLDRSQEFFKDVANKQSVKICGINMECGKEGPTPPNPPEPLPGGKCLEESKFVEIFTDKLKFFTSKLDLCSK